MQRVCHVLPYEVADGPANMALDDVLLDEAAAEPGAACLRAYGWTVPTLSLGYFQPISAVRAQPRWEGLAVVRRQTGGGAICHHHELTYAFALPARHPLARPSTQLYRAVHDAIAQALAELGVTASRRDRDCNATVPDQKRPLLCFTEADADDIVSVGTKIVGSAQRRRRGAVLQHGSILWARSCWAPELIGISDLADVSVQPSDWSSQVLSAISKALNLIPQPSRLSKRVCLRALEVEHDRYRNAAWTEMR
jgi:lipoyl(octanoyl) transferase